jgi:NADH:quinone reductase (non-electrogenic)
MDWSTRVTRLLNCKYPIIEGSFGGFGTAVFGAAVSEAGGLGMITAGALRTPERLRQDIRKARTLTNKPFGVNLSIGLINNPNEMLQVAIEEKVPVLANFCF